MSTSPHTSDTHDKTPTDGGREALERSEKKADEKQPDNYKDKANEEKLVEIGPDLTERPIKGIDPAEDEPSKT